MPVVRGISTSKYIAASFDLITLRPITTYSQLSIIINLIIYFCNLFELYNIYIHLRLWGDLIMVAHATNQPSRTEGGYTLQSANGQEMWLWLTMIFVSDNYFHRMNNLTARIALTSTSCSKDVCDVDRTTRRSSTKQNIMPHAKINHVECGGVHCMAQ